MKAAANSNNRRDLRVNATQVLFDHYDNTATLVTSEITPGGSEMTTPWDMRGRWARAALLDDSTKYGGLRLNTTEDYDVSSGFTFSTSALSSPLVALGGPSPSDTANAFVHSVAIRTRESGP